MEGSGNLSVDGTGRAGFDRDIRTLPKKGGIAGPVSQRVLLAVSVSGLDVQTPDSCPSYLLWGVSQM